MKCVTFTGGLGAQLVSTAAYLFLERAGESVVADMSYFEIPKKIEQLAALGIVYAAKESIFSWQLNNYGLIPSSFLQNETNYACDIIHDGGEKSEYALKGFRMPQVRERLKITKLHETSIMQMIGNPKSYCCAHLRRGDFMDVASVVVGDELFIAAVKSVAQLTQTLILVTDTELSSSLEEEILKFNTDVRIVVGGDPFIVHALMRLSSILITSNSQFSLTAAYLREPNQLTLVPLDSETSPAIIWGREVQIVAGYKVFTH
jgi:hypothetical protein